MEAKTSTVPSLKGIASTAPPSLLERRLKDIFPPGLESKSASSSCARSPYIFAPDQLYRMLTDNYDRDRHVEHTIVKSAWYGKQTKSARHEFIVIQVEDTKIQGLENYLVLDRNNGDPAASTSGVAKVCTSSRGATALDAFRVSYDGNEKQLLRACLLDSHRCLERIDFHSEEPLLLHQLATLAYHVSERSPRYHAMDANCYWFTGLIWECMRQMCPGASYEDRAAKKRGKIGWIRYFPNPIQVWDVVREVQEKILSFESNVFEPKNSPVDVIEVVVSATHELAKESTESGAVETHGIREPELPQAKFISLLGCAT